MDHIKNRPKSVDADSAVVRLDLPDPNLIGQMTDWELDFRQIEPGPMKTRIRARAGRDLNLLEADMNRAVHQTGAAPVGTLTFAVLLSDAVSQWQGSQPSFGAMLSMGAKDGFEAVNRAGFHTVTFSAPLAAVERISESVGGPVLEHLLQSGTVVSGSHGSKALGLARRAIRLLARPTENPFGTDEEEELLTLLLDVSCGPECLQDRSSPRTRHRALRNAVEEMQCSTDDNLPVSCFCQSAGVSRRTLNRAFNEYFGIGPKAYYLRLRLNRFRQKLLIEQGCNSIADSANQLGFWHMGQLARSYREQFGELPSETQLGAKDCFPN